MLKKLIALFNPIDKNLFLCFNQQQLTSSGLNRKEGEISFWLYSMQLYIAN